jgi:hypothetical protein
MRPEYIIAGIAIIVYIVGFIFKTKNQKIYNICRFVGLGLLIIALVIYFLIKLI